MYNWSTREEAFEKGSEHHEIWRIEQLVNFGLNGEKLNEAMIKKYWLRLSLDPARRALLNLLIYGQRNFDSQTG